MLCAADDDDADDGGEGWPRSQASRKLWSSALRA
eukprot:CAMPEP_0183464138 /NCGR_PEP_ID=MMETSP0370-20130417/144861_1 /TAXON_ID=268820 /ORGANISM="Peridinium aciculiferum, Strain PAER-2" /LENGTH=33 /DNA_ID= /DNA_START= /DNA_END= /DNA_ORIENTATION=